MRFRRIAAAPAAADFVDTYWVLETGSPASMQRVVPDGAPELILHLGAPFESYDGAVWRAQPAAFVAGQLTAPLLLRPTGSARVLGVTFRPDALPNLLDARPDELTSGIHALDLGAVDSIPSLERWLLTRRRPPADPLVGEAVRQLARSSGTRDIASLARHLGLSTRHLERRFLHRIGLSPKLYARMRRFQSVFPAIDSGADWASAATACGYYDQAHLIRDFRQFAGEPPAALLAAKDLARHFLAASR